VCASCVTYVSIVNSVDYITSDTGDTAFDWLSRCYSYNPYLPCVYL